MAIKTQYIVEKDGRRDEYPEAYVRVQKINTVNAEYEYFKNIDDPNRPDVSQEVAWERRIETTAVAYVWADEAARQNRAQVIDWFTFEFDYDLNDLDNIYQQAYAKIREIFTISDDVI